MICGFQHEVLKQRITLNKNELNTIFINLFYNMLRGEIFTIPFYWYFLIIGIK